MSARSQSRLEPVRAKVRRLGFVVGLGLFAVGLGSILAGAIALRLQGVLQNLSPPVVGLVAHAAVTRLWVYALLPGLLWSAARVLELKPWSTPVGAALTGEVLVQLLALVSAGFQPSGPRLAVDLLTLVGGVLLGRRAVIAGRAAAARASLAAERAAEARNKEYEVFAAEAERIASRREEAPISDQQPTTNNQQPAVNTPPAPDRESR